MTENSALIKQLRAEMKRKVLNGISTNKQFVENDFTWKQLIPTDYLTKKDRCTRGVVKKVCQLKFKKVFIFIRRYYCLQNPLKIFSNSFTPYIRENSLHLYIYTITL